LKVDVADSLPLMPRFLPGSPGGPPQLILGARK
jgi:hypothetical protein